MSVRERKREREIERERERERQSYRWRERKKEKDRERDTHKERQSWIVFQRLERDREEKGRKSIGVYFNQIYFDFSYLILT